MIFEHPRHIQILHGDDVKSLHQIGGELMQRIGIGPDIRNSGVELSHTLLGFLHCSATKECASRGG